MRVNLGSRVNITCFSVGNSNQNQKMSINRHGATDFVSFGNNATELVSKVITPRVKLSNLNFLEFAQARLKFKDYAIPVRNPQIAAFMDEAYTAKSFEDLFEHADSHKVFDFQVNEKTGFVKTSDISTEEDYKMADAVWVTDSCRNISLLKAKRPELCTKALESLSSFYKQQEHEFNKVINNPDIYKNNPGWSEGGVGHVFNPATNEVNPDFPKTRLESIGNYLQRSTELIVGGLSKGTKYGYKSVDEVSNNTIESMANCVKYLKAINYPQARSCGAWEENTFNSSLLSDTSIINEGLRRVLKLMYVKTSNPEILKLRERMLKTPNGDVFKSKDDLTELLEYGEERIIFNHYEEAPGERKLDAALSFVSHYAEGKLTHSKIVMKDIKEHVKLLEMLEGDSGSRGLVGENGVARYLNDEYKNLNYDIPSKKGKINENHEAQWFMVSDMSKGYGVQLKKLIKVITKEERTPNAEENAMLDKLLKKETEYINRSYARITGNDLQKANGKNCAEYKAAESYQAITDDNNKVIYVPGTNTPLAWAQSSLLEASKIYSENLKALEKTGWLNPPTKITLVA